MRRRTSARRLRAGPEHSRRAGFTLTELLIATAITLIFGVMAVATLRYGSALWRGGHRRGYAYDIASFIFHQLEDDLTAAKPQYWSNDPDAFDPRVRFYLDRDHYYEMNYGYAADPFVGRQRLRFVRGIPEETPNQLLRQAGDGVDNDVDGFVDEEYYDLVDLVDTDGDGLLDAPDGGTDEDLLPLEGMYEVAYLIGLDATPGTGDAHKLYRGVLSPIGDANSFFAEFDQAAPDTWDYDDNVDDPLEVQARTVSLAENVLHFEVRCWTQYTTTWEAQPFWRWLVSPVVGGVFVPCGPAFAWDSDRRYDDPGPGVNDYPPYFVMDWGYTDPVTGLLSFPDEIAPGVFRDSDGDTDPDRTDADYVRDNVFPRAVMVVVVTDPSEEYPEPRPLRLTTGIAPGDTTIPVTGNVPAYNEAWPYLLIEDPDAGDEWVRFTEFDAATSSFVLDTVNDPLAARGVRGTPAVAHAAVQSDGSTTRVKLGYTFSRVFYNPALREQ